jgi:hypothetical protein
MESHDPASQLRLFMSENLARWRAGANTTYLRVRVTTAADGLQ